MKTFGTFLGTLLGLALLAAFLTGGYFLFKYVANLFGTLEPQAETIVMIAAIVAFLCAAIIASGLKARCTNEGATVQKAAVYERLAAFRADQLKREKTGAEGRADDSELVKLEQLLALHGSPKVIKAYMELRQIGREAEKENSEILGLMNKLVLAMRADLGRKELNVKEKDIYDLLLGRS
jgi:hypothetical protein